MATSQSEKKDEDNIFSGYYDDTGNKTEDNAAEYVYSQEPDVESRPSSLNRSQSNEDNIFTGYYDDTGNKTEDTGAEYVYSQETDVEIRPSSLNRSQSNESTNSHIKQLDEQQQSSGRKKARISRYDEELYALPDSSDEDEVSPHRLIGENDQLRGEATSKKSSVIRRDSCTAYMKRHKYFILVGLLIVVGLTTGIAVALLDKGNSTDNVSPTTKHVNGTATKTTGNVRTETKYANGTATKTTKKPDSGIMFYISYRL